MSLSEQCSSSLLAQYHQNRTCTVCQHASTKIALSYCGENTVCCRFVAWVERRKAMKAESDPSALQLASCPHCAEISSRAGFRVCCVAGWSVVESEQQVGKWYYRADDTGATQWEHPTARPLEKAAVRGAIWMAEAPRALISCPVCDLKDCCHFGVRAVNHNSKIPVLRFASLENGS